MGLIFIVPLTTASFPQVTLPGTQSVDVTQSLMPVYGEDTAAIVFDVANYSQWSLTPSSATLASLNASLDGLVLQGTFPPAATGSALTIFRPVQVNLTMYQIFYVSIRVSTGVGYGIRFYSRLPGASTIGLWSDDDALNHRKGTGQFENIQVNMERVIEVNTARAIPTLTEVRVYLERAPSSGPTSFELQLQKFKFFTYPLKPAQSAGAYHAIYFTLRRPQVSSSWVLQTISLEGVLDASANTAYLVYLLSGLNTWRIGPLKYGSAPQSAVYTISLSAVQVKAFSETLPLGELSLVMVASSGILHQFSTKSILLNYLSPEARTSSPIRTGTPDLHLAILGGLLLVLVSILVYEQLRTKKKRGEEARPSPAAKLANGEN